MSTISVYGEPYTTNSNLQFMRYDEPTDEKLLKLAKSQAEKGYKDEFDRLFDSTKSKKGMMLRAIKDAEKDYSDSTREMNRHFEETGQVLSDEALSRGLGRSSYALDLQMNNQTDKQRSLQKLLDYKVSAVNEVQNQIDSLEKEFLNNQNYLSRKKTEDIQNILTGLKAERDETIRDVIEYNNKIAMQQKNYLLKKLIADRDHAIDKAKLKKRTYSRSSYGKSTGAVSKLLDDWSGLTQSGKLKYYNDNYQAIRGIDYDIYDKIAKEVTYYAKSGVRPSKNKNDNYYK